MLAARMKGWGAAALLVALVPQVASACTISLSSAGTLRPSANNTTLGSQVNGNTPAQLVMVLPLLTGVAVTVNPPTRVQSPTAYNANLETREVAYDATVLGLAQVASRPYSNQASTFTTGVLGAVALTITVHNRIINPNGFAPGTYQTRTMLTCRPP